MKGLTKEDKGSLARIYKVLHEANVDIKDEDLKRALSIYELVIDFFKTLGDRKFELTVGSLQVDLQSALRCVQYRKWSSDLGKKEKMKPVDKGVCKECGSKLTSVFAVQRTYHLPKNKKCTLTGHYTNKGDFESDERSRKTIGGAQTFDGDDMCNSCSAIVG